MTQRIEEFEQAFFRDPSDVDAFATLQRHYKDQGRNADLAALFERRAAHLRDSHKAADLLFQAATFHEQLDDSEAQLRVLTKAVELHKGHTRALHRLKDLNKELQRWTEVLWLMSREIEALKEAGGDGRKQAQLEHEAGQIWEEHFHRLDRAIHHYQLAFKADPRHTAAIEAGRQIYRSVGHWKTVASLYQVELTTCSEAQRKAALLLEVGQLHWDKLGDMEAAARAISEASQLRPGDEKILETLGELYASPEWPVPGGLDKAASIFMQIGKNRQSRGDRDEAISYLRRALGADPENETAYSRLEKAYEETGRWDDLDRLYRQRLSVATEVESVDLMMRRGELLERKLGDRKCARECYEAVLPREPFGGPASNRLNQLYRADKDYQKLADLIQQALEQTNDRSTRVRLMMELAFIYRDHLERPAPAAHLLHEVLQLEPGHRKALTAYEDYFRKKGDYRNLTELLRFAAQSAADAGAPPMEICARLEELADVSERHLGDLEGAIEAWQQISRHHPDVNRAQEALGRLGAKLRMWQGMVNVLDRELAQTTTPAQRIQALRRMAQVYYEKKADPQRTISILRELLQQSPHDENSLRMLVDLYERESDHDGLAWTLERKLEGIITKSERVNLLRRLASLYAEQLESPRDAMRVLQALLEVIPSDSKAHDQLEEILEQEENLEQLARSLEHRSQTSRSAGERLQALIKLARLTDEQLSDPGQAAAYWEEVRAQDPDDKEALEALGKIYEQTGRTEELLQILTHRLKAERGAAPVARSTVLRQVGHAAARLNRTAEAVDAYEQLMDILPGDRETTTALSRLYTTLDRHDDLVGVLGRQIELCDDPEQRVVLAFKQGDVLEEKLGDLEGAARVYERIIAEYSPGDLDAHRKLKHLYTRQENNRSACEIAERELFLTPEDSPDRLSLSLEIANLWRDKVRDDPRAVLAYERVLDQRPDNADALMSLRRLYHRIGSYAKLVKLAPTLFSVLEDSQERLILLLEIAQVYESNLREPESAFEWYRRAHDLYPEDPSALEHLRRLAHEFGLWEELITAHLEVRQRSTDPEKFLQLTRQVTMICADQLRDATRAFQTMAQGLKVDPAGEQILTELEELAGAAQQHEELLDIYDQILLAVEDHDIKRDILTRKAALAETKLQQPRIALADMIQLHAMNPDDDGLLLEAERLAGLADTWDDVLNLHAKRFSAAGDDEPRIEILARVAVLLEEQVGDHERAFMIWLQAFALRHEDQTIVDHLWRLAENIEGAPLDEEVQELDMEEIHELEDEEMEVLEGDLQIESDRVRGDQTQKDTSAAPGSPPPPPASKKMPAPPLPVTRGAPPPIPGARPIFDVVPGGFSPWAELARAITTLPAEDPPRRIENLLAVADVWTRGKRSVDRAMAALAEAAAIDIEHPRLERVLRETADQCQRIDQLVTLYLDALERSADAPTLVRLNLKLGDLLVAHERPGRAADHLNAVLVIEPANEDAGQRLEQLYTDEQQWDELASLRVRQLEVLGGSLDPAQRKARMIGIADIHQHTLGKPFEAVEFLARIVAEDPSELTVTIRLADLFEELSIWPKLIETLEAAVALSDQSSARVNYLQRIARTYDLELELPDKAMEAYQKILIEQPHNTLVLEALERLYAAHDRPGDLIQVLELQVDLADHDPRLARPLLVRLAVAHEHQGRPEEALVNLQRARDMGGVDPDIEEVLARLMVHTGRPDDAVELIQSQVLRARQDQRPPEAICSLMVRLSRLQDQELDDVDGARRTLDEALETQPENMEVLQTLGELLYRREFWSDYVVVLERLSDADSEKEHAISNLMTAALLSSQQLGDGDQAIRLYERVLELDPGHLPAVEQLVRLCRTQPPRLEQFLILKRDLLDDPLQKAQTLTELGRVRRELDAPHDEVTALFHEALELSEDFIPALDALSELYMSMERYEPARVLLVDAMDRLGLSRETGALVNRLGQIFERLGRDEEGFRYLMDALRMDAQNLMIRIGVGQNRFRAQRWREALRHLQEVPDHPDLENHREAGAEALFAAGQCETTLQRNDRATRYFERALELDPGHQGAVRGLAQAAMDTRQWQQAADYLRHEISLLDDPVKKIPRLEILGDVLHSELGDPIAAAECYEELFECLPDEEATRLEILPRILPVLREAGVHGTTAKVAEALAEIMWGEAEKRDMLLVAAEAWTASGATERAAAHYRSVLALEPWLMKAGLALSRLLAAEGRGEDEIEVLSRLLAEPRDEESAHQEEPQEIRAEIHARLAKLHAGQGQDDMAIASSLQALELAEDLEIRDLLAGLLTDRPEHAEAALTNHRRLLEASPCRAGSLEALARASMEQAPYRAYCFCQALQAMETTDEETGAFLARYAPPTLDDEAPYPGEITDAERWDQLSLPAVHGLSEIFATLWEAAPALFSRDLTTFGVTPDQRVSPVGSTNLAKVFGATARALGLKQTALYLKPIPDAPAFQVVAMAPPAVIVSELAIEGRSIPELRFLVGRALEMTQPAYILAAGMHRADFARLLSSVLRAFHPRFMRGRSEMGEEAMEQAASLRRSIPFKIARKLGELFRKQVKAQFDSGAWRQAVSLSANRVGLALCGDLPTALGLLVEETPTLADRPLAEVARASVEVRDLLTFAVSDAYFATRIKLGLGG